MEHKHTNLSKQICSSKSKIKKKNIFIMWFLKKNITITIT